VIPFRRLFFAPFLWLLMTLGAASTSAQQPAASSVLVLVSRSPSDSWTVPQVEGIRRTLAQEKPAISPIVEYMDWQSSPSGTQDASLASYFAGKYTPDSIRVIVAVEDPALNFLLAHRDQLFPKAEVVACGIQRLDDQTRRSWLTAVIEQTDAPGTFRLALQLQPDLERLLIIDEVNGIGAGHLSRIESTCPDEIKRVKIELANGSNTQSLFTAVENLPQKSAVLLGRNRLPLGILNELKLRSHVPIYGLRAPIHFPGVVGGSLLDADQHGAAAAGLAVRLLRGEKASTIPLVANLPPRLIVDHAEMQRRNLSFDRLPAGATVVNQPPSFWSQHGPIILVASGVILALGAALFSVLVQSRQNRATSSKLNHSLSTLHATFDSTADGILVVDKDGRISACNERFLELWNVPRDLADRKHDDAFLRHTLLQLKDPSAFLARVRDLYSHADASSQGELVEFKDGRIFERDSRPLRQGKEITGRVWSFRDVTLRVRTEREKRRMGDQLAQTQKMEALGNLAGGIAHDFNNILTGVIGYVELAKARLPGRHPAADDLDHVLRASERAKDLVRQILTFSRKRSPEKRAIGLEPVVRDTLKLMRAVVPASIEIRAELAPNAGTVLADPTQIHQAVLNLATNAVHAIGQATGQICVNLQYFEVTPEFAVIHPPLHPGGHVCLSITDTGHGMDTATIKRIFEPFFTTKAPGEGTGLGLAVVQAIIQGHDGVLTVESQLNRGSAFSVYLPLASESQILKLPEIEVTPEGSGEHILVVDDEAMITEVSRCFLESLNYYVTVAHSPEQALVEFNKNPASFAAIVTDFNMPHMNGLELLRRLRAIRPNLPALLCTGYIGSAATESEAADLGMREILGKPFTRHTLGLALHNTLRAAVAAPH
jgi:two-component system cell cycle sensor histidine kinase/response regulator CckA